MLKQLIFAHHHFVHRRENNSRFNGVQSRTATIKDETESDPLFHLYIYINCVYIQYDRLLMTQFDQFFLFFLFTFQFSILNRHKVVVNTLVFLVAV